MTVPLHEVVEFIALRHKINSHTAFRNNIFACSSLKNMATAESLLESPTQIKPKIYFTICGYGITKVMLIGVAAFCAIITTAAVVTVAVTSAAESSDHTVYYEGWFYGSRDDEYRSSLTFTECSLVTGEWIECTSSVGAIKQRLNGDETIDICISQISDPEDVVHYVSSVELKTYTNGCVSVSYEFIAASYGYGNRFSEHYLCQTDGTKDWQYLNDKYDSKNRPDAFRYPEWKFANTTNCE